MLNVHLRILDADTGKPTPVRLRVTDAHGRYVPPLGRLAHFSTAPGVNVGGNVMIDGRPWAYIDGACELPLSPGPYTLEATKGPEYHPLRVEGVLTAGKLALRHTIRRAFDPRKDGWYSGDMRCHHLSPTAAALEGAAEGLSVVHLLARETPPDGDTPGSISNILEFSGTEPRATMEGCSVFVNTFNEHPVLGSVSLLNSHRPVFPLRGGAGAADWSVVDWCDQCKRKTGLTVWADVGPFTDGAPQGEALAAVLMQNLDAFELTADDIHRLDVWDALATLDFRTPPVGASAKDGNAVPLGRVRTYARHGDGTFSPEQWTAAVREGLTYVTEGPLLDLRTGGSHAEGAGNDLDYLRPGARLPFEVTARSVVPFERLELFGSSGFIAAATPEGDPPTARIETEVVVTESGWVAARTIGRGAFSRTNAYFISTGTRRVLQARNRLSDLLDRSEAAARLIANADTREHVLAHLADAREHLLRRSR